MHMRGGAAIARLALALSILLWPGLIAACSDTGSVAVAPAPDRPTMVWIFSDP